MQGEIDPSKRSLLWFSYLFLNGFIQLVKNLNKENFEFWIGLNFRTLITIGAFIHQIKFWQNKT